MLGLRLPELLLIIAILVLLFGGKKIPQLGAGIGGAIRNFKKAMRSGDDRATLERPRDS